MMWSESIKMYCHVNDGLCIRFSGCNCSDRLAKLGERVGVAGVAYRRRFHCEKPCLTPQHQVYQV